MIPFRCQSSKQEMSAPDSMAGHFEECPECKAIVAVPGPSDVPLPNADNVVPSAAGTAQAARWLAASSSSSNSDRDESADSGIARVLTIVGTVIAALSVLTVMASVCLMLLVGQESLAAAGAGIAAGTYGFLAGILFCGLGAMVSELRAIRRLLVEQIVSGLANRPRP